MSKSAAQKAELKRKAKHELEDLVVIFLYLAFFFCALTTYSMLLLHQFDQFQVKYWNYALALINALVVTKVILIGEVANFGRRYESRPLLLSAVYKAFMFCLLVLAFHLVEELVKRLVHGAGIAAAFRDIRVDELLARAIVIFCTFIPLFAFRELRRVLRDEKFYKLLFRSEEAGRSDLSPSS